MVWPSLAPDVHQQTAIAFWMIVGVALAAFVAATVAGVSGFGGAVLLLPVLVWSFGAQDAVVVLTVAQLAGNGSRVALHRRDVDREVLARFAIGAIPAALIGGFVFAALAAGTLSCLLGGFLIAAVIWRHVRRATHGGPTPGAFSAIGVVFGFLSAVLGSVGPLLAPFFLDYGLLKGAYIGTEAACTIAIHLTKLLAYGATGVLTGGTVLTGLVLVPAMIAGSLLGRRLLGRISDRGFVVIVDAVLVVSGVLLIIA